MSESKSVTGAGINSPTEKSGELFGAETKCRSMGFNVVGYISGNSGMGVAARSYIKLLLKAGHKVSCLDVSPGYERGSPDLSCDGLVVGNSLRLQRVHALRQPRDHQPA